MYACMVKTVFLTWVYKNQHNRVVLLLLLNTERQMCINMFSKL